MQQYIFRDCFEGQIAFVSGSKLLRIGIRAQLNRSVHDSDANQRVTNRFRFRSNLKRNIRISAWSKLGLFGNDIELKGPLTWKIHIASIVVVIAFEVIGVSRGEK